MFIWDGEKAVEDKGKKKPQQKEPELVWDGENAVPVKKKDSPFLFHKSAGGGHMPANLKRASTDGSLGLTPLNISQEQVDATLGNQTVQPPKPQAGESTNITQGTRQAEVRQFEREKQAENEAKETGYAQKAIEEGKGNLLETAAAFMSEQDPKFKGQLAELQKSDAFYEQSIGDILSGKPSVPMKNRADMILGEATKGKVLFNAMTNPRFLETIRGNKELYAKFREEAGNLINHYPEFGRVYLGGVISKALEDEGETNSIGNIISKSKLDRIVEKLKQRGELDEGEIAFINREIRPRMGVENLFRSILDKPSVKTPGFFENAAQGGVGGLRNFGQTLAEGGPLGGAVLPNFYEDYYGKQGALSRDIERENTKVAFKPVGLLHEMSTIGGNMFGQSLATGGGAKGLMNLGIKSPALALGTSAFLQSYGNYAKEARLIFPDSKGKQIAYSNGMSLIEAGTEGMFNDIKVVNAILGHLSPTVKETIQKFTNKEISAATANQTVKAALTKAIEKTPAALKSFGKNIAQNELEEISASILGQGWEGLLEGKPIDKLIEAEKIGETARSTLLGSGPISILGTVSDLKKNQGMTAKQIYLMAREPEYWSQAISETEGLDEMDVQDRLGNLEYAANLLKELDGNSKMTEKQKTKFLLTSLQNKIKGEQQTNVTDPVLRAKAENEINESIKANDTIKEDLLSGKDDGTFEGDKSDQVNKSEEKLFEEIEKAAPQGYKETLKAAKDEGNILGGLEYMQDKAAENPVKFAEEFGQELTDKVLKNTPTEKIQEAFDYLIENNTDDPSLPVLDKILQDREPKTEVVDEAEQQLQQPVTEAVEAATENNEQEPPAETVGATEPTTAETQSTEEGQPPISEPPNGSRIHVERPKTELSHKGLQDVANEFSLDDVQTRDRKTDIQLRQDAENTINNWAEKGEYSKKVEGLVEKAEAGEVLTDEQRVILEQHLANVTQELRELPKNSPEFDTKLAEVKRLKDAGERTRSEAGAALRIPTFRSSPKDVTDYYVAEMEAAGVDKLTEKQKETAEKEFDAISKAEKEYQDKIESLTEENNRLKAEQAVKGAKKKSTGQKKDYKAERTKIFEDIKEKLKKSDSNGPVLMAIPIPYLDKVGKNAKKYIAIAPDVAKLMKSYVEQGVSELADIVKNIHGDLKDAIPDVTEKDVRDILAGKYNEKRTRNEMAEKLQDLRTEAKLLDKYEKLQKGEPKTEKEKVEKNRASNEIRQKIKNFENKKTEAAKEAKAEAERVEKEYNESVKKAEKLGKEKAAADKKKADAEQREDAKAYDKHEKEKAAKELKEAADAARAEAKRIEDEYNEEKAIEEKLKKAIEKESKKLPPEEKELFNYKKKLADQIAGLEKDIQTGNYAPDVKKEPLKLDKEAQDLRNELLKLKEQRTIRLMKLDYEKKSKLEKAFRFSGQILSIPRTLKSSFDVSMPGRQGIWGISRQLLTLPIGSNKDFHVQKQLLDQFKKMYQAVGHEKHYRNAMADIKEHPRYELAEKAGLKLTDPNSELQEAREEAYGPNIISKYVPFFGKPVKVSDKLKVGGLTQISERSASMFVNQMKWDVFNTIADVMEANGKTIENSIEDYKQAANYANKVVGRGVVGKKVENIGYITSRLFFSLKLAASRIQLLTDVVNPYFYHKAPKEVREAYWKDYIKFVALSGTALLLARAAGGDTEDDPTNSDAGKIRVGKSRYDPLGGFGQYGVFGARMIAGETTSATTGKTSELGNKKGQTSRAGLLIKFIRSKSSPEAGFVWNVLEGKDAIGKPTTLGKETGELFTPLMYKDIQSAFQDQSVLGAVLTTLLIAHGVGYGSYDAPKK